MSHPETPGPQQVPPTVARAHAPVPPPPVDATDTHHATPGQRAAASVPPTATDPTAPPATSTIGSVAPPATPATGRAAPPATLATGRTAPPATTVTGSAAAAAPFPGASAPPVTSAPLARLTIPDQSRRPPHDPDGPTDAREQERTGPSGRTSRLHIGWHAIPRTGLRRVAIAAPPGSGLLLGRDQHRSPVPLRVFAPEPVRITLVGGVWAAQLLIFRAFALGARAIVVTTEPQAWSGFGERATGQYNRLTVLSSDQGGFPPGTAQLPTLTVYDLGMTGPATPPPLGEWHTQLTILRQLDRSGVTALQDARIVLLQRLGGEEVAIAAPTLRMGPESRFLEAVADDMLAVVGDGADQYVFLQQTALEQQYVGPPRR
ncbi:hypothetical protein [Actinoplanes sp. GCM10030250]|uniref:hypothetical protein n=1 Tax=Actinoplanes sp. GCM10030250 TaxID=3273376 RepID=UPI00360FF16B